MAALIPASRASARLIALCCAVLGCAVFCAGALAVPPRAAAVSKEYQVKAAFLYNFAKFVEWPAARFTDETSPIEIAVIGRNPFGDELENVVRGRTINGRSISVSYVLSTDNVKKGAAPYHVVYVTAGEERGLEQLAQLWSNASWLTVGESPRFAAQGGMVKFSTVDEKVRFEINADAAETAGLRISAQLLKLATAVRRTEDEKNR